MQRQLTLALLRLGIPWRVARKMDPEEAMLWLGDWKELNSPPSKEKTHKVRRKK
jgi:hypothetical protein